MSKELKHQVSLKAIGDLKVEGVYIRTTDEYKFVKSILDSYDEAIPLNAKNNLALAIIKNKKINVNELLSDIELNPRCDNKTLCWNYNIHKEYTLTQEEYDLLKEILYD